MKVRLAPRPDDHWIQALRGRDAASAAAVEELAAYLGRVLGRMVKGRFAAVEVDDLVQESLTRIVDALGSFRGDASFTTWATGIATRVAFTELRRRSVRERGRDAFEDVRHEVLAKPSRGAPAPDEALMRSNLLQALDRAIETRLTERQRVAILAELRGIPTIEIARRLGTNQNALYKLTHDARKKLRAALVELGFTADSIHDLALEASR